MKKTLQEIMEAWKAREISHPHERRGQALFNSLYELNAELANQILGTEFDPFYDNLRIQLCLRYLEDKINE